jgi:hypothetical protein
MNLGARTHFSTTDELVSFWASQPAEKRCSVTVLHRQSRPTGNETVPHPSDVSVFVRWVGRHEPGRPYSFLNNLQTCFFLGLHRLRKNSCPEGDGGFNPRIKPANKWGFSPGRTLSANFTPNPAFFRSLFSPRLLKSPTHKTGRRPVPSQERFCHAAYGSGLRCGFPAHARFHCAPTGGYYLQTG